MKRWSILIIFLVLFFGISYCQFNIGFNAGINVFLHENPYDNGYDFVKFNPEPSYSLALGIKPFLIKKLCTSIEISYEHYKTKIHNGGGTVSHSFNWDYNLTLKYFSVSLLPEFYFFKKKLLFINIGPYYSQLNHSYRTGVYSGWNIVSGSGSGQLTGSEKYIRKYDCGLSTSLGLCFKHKSNTYIMPKLKYTHSFITKFDNKVYYGYRPYIEKIRTLSFFLEIDVTLVDKKNDKL